MAAGIGIAQVIPFLFSFLIARVYTPEQFGIFGLLLSVTGPLSAIVCLRYEQSILLPEKDSDAIKILKSSWLIAFTLAFVFSFLFYFIQWSGRLLSIRNLPVYIFLLTLFIGIAQPVNFWLQRKKEIKKIATLKIIQTAFISVITYLLGILSLEAGMMAGYITGWFILSIFSLFIFHNTLIDELKKIKVTFFKELLFKYKDFPIYNTLPSILQAICISIPLWIAEKKFDTQNIGYFNLSRQLLMVFTGLLIPAVTQVFYQKTVELQQNNKPQWFQMRKLMLITFSVALLMILPLLFFGEEIFSFFYGKKWTFSGKLAGIMVFSTAIQLIFQPLAVILNTFRKVYIISVWQVFYFAVLLVLYLPDYASFQEFVLYCVATEFLVFVLLGCIIVFLVLKNDKKIDLLGNEKKM